jgi:peptidoglycan hydrolase-like protein with peptidoglycan-binding domain
VAELQRRLTALDRYEGGTSGAYDERTRAAIEAFAGEYNLEGKMRDDEFLYESLVREIRDVTPEANP